jgi:hypothetical protein
MKHRAFFHCSSTVIGLLALSLVVGCGDATGHAQFKPGGDEARAALTATLSAWQSGQPYGTVEMTPPVRVADSAWQGGRVLEKFEIGAEEDPGDGTKQFEVTLTTKPSKVETTRYVVNGRDPIWVFGREDYKRMINMDNPEPAPKGKSKRGPAKPRS